MISVFSSTKTHFVVACLVIMSSACSVLPESREPIKTLDISMQAVTDLNPDVKSRPAPIIVRIYELKSEATFVQADFFSLHNSDKATLTDDLLVRDEFLMRPGDRITIRRKAHPQLGAIGVLAAFRDLPYSTWRATYRLPPSAEATWYRRSSSVNLQIQLEDNAVRILGD
jgi:type VI secretion system protein VasD